MKRLYRDRFDKVLGGVCGGMAQYFHLDSSIIRLIYASLALFSLGIFVVVYVILWILLPLGPRAYVVAHYKKLYRSKTDRKVTGLLGGLGAYLKIDANILRLIFLVLLFTTGIVPLLILYIAGAAVVPESPN